MGQNRPLFVYFSLLLHDKYSTNTINEKRVNGMLGTQTQGGRMVGADASTELLRHPEQMKGFYVILFLSAAEGVADLGITWIVVVQV